MQLKFKDLTADDIECRVNTVSDKGCSLLLYKDARCDMRILDEAVGPMNWKRSHELINGNLFCKWNGEVKCLSPNFIFEDGVLFNKDKSTIISFRDKDMTSYVIPDYVTSIGGDAFSGCESLTSLVIPDCVVTIGHGAFRGCSS